MAKNIIRYEGIFAESDGKEVKLILEIPAEIQSPFVCASDMEILLKCLAAQMKQFFYIQSLASPALTTMGEHLKRGSEEILRMTKPSFELDKTEEGGKDPNAN